MNDLAHVNISGRYRRRMARIRRPGLLVRVDSSSCWVTLFLLSLAFVVQIAGASAAPPPFRVGACLSATDIPPSQPGESDAQRLARTFGELKDIASYITRKVRESVMTVDYPMSFSGPIPPSPSDCRKFQKKQEYDIWLHLIYATEDGGFAFDVSQWKGKNLVQVTTNPEDASNPKHPWPDAKKTRELLADAGQQIVQDTAQPIMGPIPIERIRNARSGIIFLYDSSSSMHETDDAARKRLSVNSTFGDILMHTAQVGTQPVPFAVVVFDDGADVLENTPGSKWFQTTPADLQTAHVRLIAALKDKGGTNIGAAFEKLNQLITSRKDIERWHVVFITDGVPTVGITDYAELTRAIKADLDSRSTLSTIALHGNDPSHTETAKLAALVNAIRDAAGKSGLSVNVKHDDPVSFRRDIERIVFSISEFTVRVEVDLKCTYDSSAEREECRLDNSKPHALSFGAARQVTFIADTTALPGGKCTVTISNQGLGKFGQTLELPEDQQSTVLTDSAFKIMLSRSSDRVFLTIEMTSGRVNGDWQIGLTVAAPTRTKP